MINTYSPMQDILSHLLKEESHHMRILSGVDNLTYLFCDLVEIGLDFFELLRI